MSKKNNQNIRRAGLAIELKRDKAEQAARAAKLAKKKESSGGVRKLKAKKAIKLRKGAIVRGVKIVDSDTRKKVERILKVEAANRMDCDDKKRRDPLAVKKEPMKTKKKVTKKVAAMEE